MKIAIMQPYFFPYIGYFQLIHSVNRFILGDDVQYIERGWVNRNRILKPCDGGFMYITVPLVKHSHEIHINNAQLKSGSEWKTKIVGQFDHYKKKAPYYTSVRDLLLHCLALPETTIGRFNAYCLKAACDYIGIDFTIELQSEMTFDYSMVTCRCDRPIEICKQLGATHYVNAPGGKSLYDPEKFQQSNIMLSFLEPCLKEYKQLNGSFEPALSILDVMMFNSPNDIRGMLNDYRLQ
jgi:hypothetical protein